MGNKINSKIITFQMNGFVITDKATIANYFGEYFSKVGECVHE